MSLAVLKSRALAGMEAQQVNVEVHLANGLPAFTIVGLADTEVKEAKDRVRAAIQNGGFEFPAQRIKGSQEENSRCEQNRDLSDTATVLTPPSCQWALNYRTQSA